MLSKIAGIIWIVFGLLWLARPEVLKNRLKKKMNRRMKKIVYGFILMFGFLLIGSVIKAPGLLPKVIGIIGAIIAIRAIMAITSTASEKMLDRLGDRSIKFFRVWAVSVLVIGVILLVI